jgi:citrate lyase subunit beta/citryl-CoA lyase
MPGSNARALEKAKTLNADALIFDLEDAVAPDAKEMARRQAAAAAASADYGSREIVIRVNGLDTPWGEPDLIAAAKAGANGILIPKVQAPGDLEAVRTVLRKAGASSRQAIWAMMETPFAVLNAGAIAAAGPGEYPLTALIMGTNDLAKETRASLDGARLGMIAWLSICVAAGRAYKIDVIDGVFNIIGDEAGLRAELEQGRLLGMDGKTLIHPSQIEPCNDAFTPPASEVEWARRIVAAFADPANAGKGVIQLDGKMVERLHAEMAKRTVALADVIAKRKASG